MLYICNATSDQHYSTQLDDATVYCRTLENCEVNSLVALQLQGLKVERTAIELSIATAITCSATVHHNNNDITWAYASMCHVCL